MKNKHCDWCDNQFQTKISYQIYCSTSCREEATKQKIAERYKIQRIQNRSLKDRRCASCSNPLSIYNDDEICQSCSSNPKEISKILKEIKDIANGKIEL
jgi:hypothetical protein